MEIIAKTFETFAKNDFLVSIHFVIRMEKMNASSLIDKHRYVLISYQMIFRKVVICTLQRSCLSIQ